MTENIKERPILFTGAIVRALLDGSKTQTRRALRNQITAPAVMQMAGPDYAEIVNEHGVQIPGWACPYGQPGDRLWVRESWHQRGAWRLPAWPEAEPEDAYWSGTNDVIYAADAPCPERGWRARPSIHMPRWASRILLEVVSVRVERLQEISEGDCWAEGIDAVDGLMDDIAILDMAKRMDRSCHDAAPTYAALWESINGAGSWDANPWVWVVEFKRVAP